MSTRRRWLALMLVLCPVPIAVETVKKFSVVVDDLRGANTIQAAGTMVAPRDSGAVEEIPGRQAILSILRKVNSYQLAHPVLEERQSAHRSKDLLRRPWPRATWYTGVMGVWKATKDSSFLEQALDYGRQLRWQVGEEQVGANRLFPIQIWAELYFAKMDRAMIEPSIVWLSTPDPLSPAGSKRWYLDARDSLKEHPVAYVDSLYGAPALAMLAQATGDKKYLDIMNSFFDDVTGQLFDQESGLYYRDPSYIGQRTTNGKKILWSRGNGWAFAGIARVLEYLPKNNRSRQRYVDIFVRQAGELIKRQGADGMWRANLDDPNEFPDPESSGTGFFCFGLAWGINQGFLNRQEYLQAVRKAWRGLTQNVSPGGKVLWGQLVDDQPRATARDSTHEYVTGAFLLAGSEVYSLAHAK